MKKDFLLTVIIPVYNEAGNISPLLTRLLPVINKFQHEVLFVDDGSHDTTVAEIKAHAKKNKNIKLISFVRNFSHQTALTCGYDYSNGDVVISMDADLQDPPELIEKMLKRWQQGYKIVYAKRTVRHESLFKTWTASFFYTIMNLLSDTKIPSNVGDFRLLDKEVVTLLNEMPERSRFLRGLVAWGGYPAAFVSFERKERSHGKTHYPLDKMVSFALSGILSFSVKPLRFATYFGFLSAFIGFAGVTYAIALRLFFPDQFWVTGWTTIFVGIMFFGGVQLITIGIIGEYIAKIYSEIQRRPHYIVGEKVNIKDEESVL